MRTGDLDNIRHMCAKTRHSRSFQHSQSRVRKDFSASRRGEREGLGARNRATNKATNKATNGDDASAQGSLPRRERELGAVYERSAGIGRDASRWRCRQSEHAHHKCPRTAILALIEFMSEKRCDARLNPIRMGRYHPTPRSTGLPHVGVSNIGD